MYVAAYGLYKINCIYIYTLIYFLGKSVKQKKEGSKLKLKVGENQRFPGVSEKQGKKIKTDEPTSDVVPQSAQNGETIDHQAHQDYDGKI